MTVVSKKDKKEKDSSTKKEVKKRIKKTYDLPGQRKETPHELDSLRMFNEALYNEFPECEAAEKFLLFHGLLPKAQAVTLAKKYAPVKATSSKKKANTTSKKKTATKSKKKAAATKSKKKVTKKKATPAKKKRKTTPKKKTVNDMLVDSDSDFEA